MYKHHLLIVASLLGLSLLIGSKAPQPFEREAHALYDKPVATPGDDSKVKCPGSDYGPSCSKCNDNKTKCLGVCEGYSHCGFAYQDGEAICYKPKKTAVPCETQKTGGLFGTVGIVW